MWSQLTPTFELQVSQIFLWVKGYYGPCAAVISHSYSLPRVIHIRRGNSDLVACEDEKATAA